MSDEILWACEEMVDGKKCLTMTSEPRVFCQECSDALDAELARLRRLEVAVMVNLSRENAIRFWRRRAEMFGDDALVEIADSLIADALEATP